MPPADPKKPHRPRPDRLTPGLLRRLQELADELCPEPSEARGTATAAPQALTADPPFPSISYWFPNPLQAGQPCYVTGMSNRTDLPHRICFLDAAGATELACAPVYFLYGSSGPAYLTAPFPAGPFYLRIQAWDGANWVGAYTVAVTVV